MKLNPVSFKGIYDIRFPKGTKSEFIDEKCKQAKDYIEKNYTNKDGESFLDVKTLDWFDKLDKRLGQEYVNKTKVELIFDTQA